MTQIFLGVLVLLDPVWVTFEGQGHRSRFMITVGETTAKSVHSAVRTVRALTGAGLWRMKLNYDGNVP